MRVSCQDGGNIQICRFVQPSWIVREQQYDAKMPDWLARQTGAKVAVIGTMANALPGTDTFVKLCEANLKALLAAAGRPK